MTSVYNKLSAEGFRDFFLHILFLSIPFSIAGDHFAIFGLYFCTLYLFAKKRERWESNLIIYGIAVLLLGAVLSSFLSDKPLTSFSYFRNFWRLGLPFVVFFALKRRDHQRFIHVLMFVSSIVGLYATIQFFTGLDYFRSASLRNEYIPNGKIWHAVGLFSHHLTYGAVSLLLFSLFIPSVIDQTLRWKERFLFTLASICNLLGVLLSMGRSIWLGLITALGVVFLLKLKLKGYIAILILLGIVCGVYSQISDDSKNLFYKKTVVGRRIDSFTVEANIDRLLMWKAAFNVIKDNPVVGLGPRRAELMQPYYDKIAKKEKHLFQHPASVGVHNIFIQNWIDFGITGLIGYLAWWLVLMGEIVYVLKKYPDDQNNAKSLLIGICGGMAAIMIAGFFENNFRDGEVQTTILTLMGLSLAIMYKIKAKSPGESLT